MPGTNGSQEREGGQDALERYVGEVAWGDLDADGLKHSFFGLHAN